MIATAESIAPRLRPGHLVVLESTTYPCTTVEAVKRLLEKGSGIIADVDFYLAFSPEREEPGNPRSLRGTPKVVGAFTKACGERAEAIYARTVSRVVPVSSYATAEATKLLENVFQVVDIALVSEL